MSDFGLTRRKVIAGAAAAMMTATALGGSVSTAFAGPKEDAARAIKALDADTAAKWRHVRELKREGAAADARAAAADARTSAAEAQIHSANKEIASGGKTLDCKERLIGEITAEKARGPLSPDKVQYFRERLGQCNA